MEVALMIMMVNLKHDGNIGKPLRPKSAIFSNIVQTMFWTYKKQI